MAVVIALRFFQQQHSNVFLKEIILEGDAWIVTVFIGIIDQKTKQVRIDAESGKILRYATIN